MLDWLSDWLSAPLFSFLFVLSALMYWVTSENIKYSQRTQLTAHIIKCIWNFSCMSEMYFRPISRTFQVDISWLLIFALEFHLKANINSCLLWCNLDEIRHSKFKKSTSSTLYKLSLNVNNSSYDIQYILYDILANVQNPNKYTKYLIFIVNNFLVSRFTTSIYNKTYVAILGF